MVLRMDRVVPTKAMSYCPFTLFSSSMNVQWYLTLVHRLCPPIFVMFPSYFTPSEINRFRSDLQVNLPLCDSSCIVIISPLFKPSTASVNDHHILEESPFGSQIPPCFSLCFFSAFPIIFSVALCALGYCPGVWLPVRGTHALRYLHCCPSVHLCALCPCLDPYVRVRVLDELFATSAVCRVHSSRNVRSLKVSRST